jgi:anti-sigma factor ChrR (cupin superfamily)
MVRDNTHGEGTLPMYQLKRVANDDGWTALDFPGVEVKVLHKDEVSGATTVLTRLAPAAIIPRHWHTVADETVYVLEGDFVEDDETYGPGSFFAGKAKTAHGPHRSKKGCVVLTQFSAAIDFILAGDESRSSSTDEALGAMPSARRG